MNNSHLSAPPQRPRTASAALAVLAMLMTFVAATGVSAQASPSGTTHPTPSTSVAGVSRLCGPNAAYACTTGGYAGRSDGWPGRYYGAGWASSNSYGYHNCTLYAAFRLAANGYPDPGGSWGNATDWDTGAAARGVRVDQSPAVGSIAQWNRGYGHVAYVEVVTSTYIEVTDDNYGLNYTDRWRISLSSAAMPDNFIHFRDLSASSSTTDAWFIKTKNTGSGRVEVHSVTPASGYQSGISTTTRFSPGDADNGWFQMVGSDLWFIKTKNTGSGKVEVHQATAASGYQSGISTTTRFSPADASNGWFQMVGSDLWFIKTRNTGSGRVEVHQATAASGYGSGVSTATRFSPGDASNGFFQMVGSDLWFAKTRNTGSGRVEVHQATAASGYQSGVSSATRFSPADANNGWFTVGGK